MDKTLLKTIKKYIKKQPQTITTKATTYIALKKYKNINFIFLYEPKLTKIFGITPSEYITFNNTNNRFTKEIITLWNRKIIFSPKPYKYKNKIYTNTDEKNELITILQNLQITISNKKLTINFIK